MKWASKFNYFADKWFGKFGESNLNKKPDMERILKKNRPAVSPKSYIARWYATVALSSFAGLIVASLIILVLILFFTGPAIKQVLFFILIGLGVFPSVITYLSFLFILRKFYKAEEFKSKKYKFERLSMRVFGSYAVKSADRYPDLPERLVKIHLNMRPEAYIAKWFASVVIAGVAGIIFSGLLIIFIIRTLPVQKIELIAAFIIILFGILPSIITYLYYLSYPSSTLNKMEHEIDRNLPFAVNYLSAMAAANVDIIKIFFTLSKYKVFGGITVEAAFIVRDVKVLRQDTITALQLAMTRSPSRKFQELLQGIITTRHTGGQLKQYLVDKARHYSTENQINLKDRMEKMGLLAETFVTVGIAGPLFLFTMALVMSILDTGANSSSMMLLTMVVFVLMPLALISFIVIFRSEN